MGIDVYWTTGHAAVDWRPPLLLNDCSQAPHVTSLLFCVRKRHLEPKSHGSATQQALPFSFRTDAAHCGGRTYMEPRATMY